MRFKSDAEIGRPISSPTAEPSVSERDIVELEKTGALFVSITVIVTVDVVKNDDVSVTPNVNE